MGQSHLLRLNAPKSWFLKRKGTKYITRSIPGPHPLKGSLTLSFMLRDILEYAKTAKEIKQVLNGKQVLVDKVARTDYKYPIGLMDVIDIPKLEESYRVVYNKKGRLNLVSINKSEADLKLLRIIRKTMVKGGQLQVTFHDGRNMLAKKFDGNIGDSVLFDLNKKTVGKILKLEKGSLVYLRGGTHVGNLGTVKDIIKARDLQKPKVIVEVDGKEYITLIDYAFVVGKGKTELKLENSK